MFAVTVTFASRPEHREDFLRQVTANAKASLETEPGCLQFDVLHDPSRPDEVFLYEVYTDRAAFDAHLATGHFQEFAAQTAPMVVDKQVTEFAEVIR